ncbi:MAG: class I SAM-dependent methyltransferase [Halioglobus sp.]
MQTVDFTHFELSSGDRVLDLGCGEGRHAIAIYLEKDVHSVGVDLSVQDLSRAREKFEDFQRAEDASRELSLMSADALSLPFSNDTFDKIICSEVLEHIPDYHSVLVEIQRILKPGGLLCVSVPRRWPEKICWWLSEEYHLVPGGHIRIFDAAELRYQVEAQGFSRYYRHWAHALHVPYWWLQCLFWETRETNWLIKQYHKLLVWDLMERPAFTRVLERALDPLVGKSVVMYFRKEVAA